MIQYKNGDIVIVRVRDKGASEYPFHFIKDMTCFSKKTTRCLFRFKA